MLAPFDPRNLTRADQEVFFTSGYCHVFALALNRRTGWPIHALLWPVDGGEQTHAGHLAVKTPDGRFLDVEGLHQDLGALAVSSECEVEWQTFTVTPDDYEPCVASGGLTAFDAEDLAAADCVAAALLVRLGFEPGPSLWKRVAAEMLAWPTCLVWPLVIFGLLCGYV